MDTQEIRALLGKSIFERAQKYRKRILQSSCTTNEDGVRHLTALVQGSGPVFTVSVGIDYNRVRN